MAKNKGFQNNLFSTASTCSDDNDANPVELPFIKQERPDDLDEFADDMQEHSDDNQELLDNLQEFPFIKQEHSDDLDEFPEDLQELPDSNQELLDNIQEFPFIKENLPDIKQELLDDVQEFSDNLQELPDENQEFCDDPQELVEDMKEFPDGIQEHSDDNEDHLGDKQELPDDIQELSDDNEDLPDDKQKVPDGNKEVKDYVPGNDVMYSSDDISVCLDDRPFVAVVLYQDNLKPLLKGDFNYIRQTLTAYVREEIRNRKTVLKFESSEERFGWFFLTCADHVSLEWALVRRIPPRGDRAFRIIPVSKLPRSLLVKVLVTTHDMRNCNDILNIMGLQNTGLETQEWKIFGKKTFRNKSGWLTLLKAIIPHKIIPVLCKLGWKPFFEFTRTIIKGITLPISVQNGSEEISQLNQDELLEEHQIYFDKKKSEDVTPVITIESDDEIPIKSNSPGGVTEEDSKGPAEPTNNNSNADVGVICISSDSEDEEDLASEGKLLKKQHSDIPVITTPTASAKSSSTSSKIISKPFTSAGSISRSSIISSTTISKPSTSAATNNKPYKRTATIIKKSPSTTAVSKPSTSAATANMPSKRAAALIPPSKCITTISKSSASAATTNKSSTSISTTSINRLGTCKKRPNKASKSIATINKPSSGDSAINKPSISATPRSSISADTVNKSSLVSIDETDSSAEIINIPSTSSAIIHIPSRSSAIIHRPSTSSAIIHRPSTSSENINRPAISGASTDETARTAAVKRASSSDSDSFKKKCPKLLHGNKNIRAIVNLISSESESEEEFETKKEPNVSAMTNEPMIIDSDSDDDLPKTNVATKADDDEVSFICSNVMAKMAPIKIEKNWMK